MIVGWNLFCDPNSTKAINSKISREIHSVILFSIKSAKLWSKILLHQAQVAPSTTWIIFALAISQYFIADFRWFFNIHIGWKVDDRDIIYLEWNQIKNNLLRLSLIYNYENHKISISLINNDRLPVIWKMLYLRILTGSCQGQTRQKNLFSLLLLLLLFLQSTQWVSKSILNDVI